ncbi:ribonuclease P protein component [Demequina sp. NBRC 110053]|uniref:ribonuclease P protein component n=1 Tax=Demequina sp. NBRC 110053 TaxID=1570342 RepID=UPI00352B7BDB
MTDAADFTAAMRQGSRSGRRTIVVYVRQTGQADSVAGFAVSKAVGGAVVRNRVKRRLRAVMRDELPQLPRGSAVVVRALPRAAEVGFVQLASDVSDALATAVRKAALA